MANPKCATAQVLLCHTKSRWRAWKPAVSWTANRRDFLLWILLQLSKTPLQLTLLVPSRGFITHNRGDYALAVFRLDQSNGKRNRQRMAVAVLRRHAQHIGLVLGFSC